MGNGTPDALRFIAEVEERIARDEEVLSDLARAAEGLGDLDIPCDGETGELLARFQSLCEGPSAPVEPLPMFGIRV